MAVRVISFCKNTNFLRILEVLRRDKTVSNWEKFLHPRGRMDVRVQIKSEISYDFDLRKKIVYIFVSD